MDLVASESPAPLHDICRQPQHFERSEWARNGFESADDSDLWGERACGIACASMILHYRGNTGLSRAELLHQGRARGAYSEPGWIHRDLGDLITNHGVPAEARGVSDLTELAEALSDGPVIASVSFQFPNNGSKGGHLVLVTGPTWTNGDISGFFFNDHHAGEPRTPTSQQPDSTPASPVGSSPQPPIERE